MSVDCQRKLDHLGKKTPQTPGEHADSTLKGSVMQVEPNTLPPSLFPTQILPPPNSPSLLTNKIILDPLTFSEARFRPSLEERLESIISGAALMADSSCTRDDRRERIVAECNAVRQALQDLLSEYMNNVSLQSCSEAVARYKDNKQPF
ncbi:unnamed protein product [Pleuronectes platessa]|uniref:Uncharacterized protein n=1 Tax=Pleuronectes platessa TaxID=8262 RepID=A0A9N7TGF8_PLEPL|nr:unnamed protein product [Pleuronectes platessa]